MSSSYFYLHAEESAENTEFINALSAYSKENSVQIFIIDGPLGDQKYSYNYNLGLILLTPKHKITFVNFGEDSDDFDEYVEDVLEDLSSISDKYRYKEVVGRFRHWKEQLIEVITSPDEFPNVSDLLDSIYLDGEKLQKKCELLISLLTGSINDIERVGGEVPDNILDKIKTKIQLFDGDQTRFIYQKPAKKVVRIQGLSGTGKTELLLHKLRDIYVNKPDSKIMFTCHNKILSHNLRRRIPEFFDFMKVEEQIKWNERLWCVNAWGSQSDINSGAYRYIVHKYQLPFSRYSWSMSFESACRIALDKITHEEIEEYGYAFDYMLIDESQDFGEKFIELCTLVTKETVFVTGDIFQSIFDTNIISSISPDFLLSKCYRTDPRTLMFSHAVGMALFEDQKLRWLESPEWKACGYILEKIGRNKLKLSREPLRRFEDIESSNLESIELVPIDDPYFAQCEKAILLTIQKIRDENPTVLAEDIGIIFVDDDSNPYEMADVLEQSIAANFSWEVNKAYETKEKLPNSIFVSNKNNVKGLEFPFVICIAKRLKLSHSFRNALYMMLTRSFLKTYFLISKNENINVLNKLSDNLAHINANGSMIVDIPSEAEKNQIKTTIKYDVNAQSFYDFFEECCTSMSIPPLFRKDIFEATKSIIGESFEKKEVEETIAFIAKKKGI